MKHRPSHTRTRPTVPPWRTPGRHRQADPTPPRVLTLASALRAVVAR